MNPREKYLVHPSLSILESCILVTRTKNKSGTPFSGHLPHYMTEGVPRVVYSEGEPMAGNTQEPAAIETALNFPSPWATASYGRRVNLCQVTFGGPGNPATREQLLCLKELGDLIARLENNKTKVTAIADPWISTSKGPVLQGRFVLAALLAEDGSVLWAHPAAIKAGVITCPTGGDQRITSLDPQEGVRPRLSTTPDPLGALLANPGLPKWFRIKADGLLAMGTAREAVLQSVLRSRGRELAASGVVQTPEEGLEEARMEVASLLTSEPAPNTPVAQAAQAPTGIPVGSQTPKPGAAKPAGKTSASLLKTKK